MDEITCPKCAHSMVRGFIPEQTHGGTSVMYWLEGEPEHSFWAAGVKIDAEKIIATVTYRCSECGLLEIYAKK